MPLIFTVLDGPQRDCQLHLATGLEACLVRLPSGVLSLLTPADELPTGAMVCLNLLFWEGIWYAAPSLAGTKAGGRLLKTLMPLLAGTRLQFGPPSPLALEVTEATDEGIALDLRSLELHPEDLTSVSRLSGRSTRLTSLPPRLAGLLKLLSAVATGAAVLLGGIAVVKAPLNLLSPNSSVSVPDPTVTVSHSGTSDPAVLSVAQALQERLLQIPEESTLDAPNTLATLAEIRRTGQQLARIHANSPLAIGVATATAAIYEVSRGASTGNRESLSAAAQSARRSLDVWSQLPSAEQAGDPALFYRSLARLSLNEAERLCGELAETQPDSPKLNGAEGYTSPEESKAEPSPSSGAINSSSASSGSASASSCLYPRSPEADSIPSPEPGKPGN
ncbi:hypothetical protein [Leptolyngbya sp. FACHB-261]|uniref:hypothetical protein n=1 Tax=Leptolyngbya sp. FACHB-261 TaxID=2692806 RepID=UPI00168320DE|nr:hypothetical protein [Leptolyngbya sp. FACHB-261]MBD2104782.1 hypothetical protein [Leptolyngbya sp. FACHB-261]